MRLVNKYIDVTDALQTAAKTTSQLFRSLASSSSGKLIPEDLTVVIDNHFKNYSDILNTQNIFINLKIIISKFIRRTRISNTDDLYILGSILTDTVERYIKENLKFVEEYCRNNLRGVNVLTVPPGSLLNRCIKAARGRVYATLARITGGSARLAHEHKGITFTPEAYIQGIVRDDVDLILIQADSVFQQGVYSPPGSLAAAKAGKEEGVRVVALSMGIAVRPTRIQDLISGLRESIQVMMEWGEEISVYANDAISINDIDELVLGPNSIIDLNKTSNIGARLLRVNSSHVDILSRLLLENWGKTALRGIKRS